MNYNIMNNYKILMVDDKQENIQLLGSILREENFKLGFATDGIQALKLLSEAKDYDLVLLDVNMPDMNGYEVCRKMKENPILKDIPVIFLSAYSEVDFIVEGFESGANDYVTKPIKKKELLARINTQLKLKESENSLKDLISEKEKLLLSEQQLLDKTLKGSIKMLIDILSMVSPLELFPSKQTSQNAKKIANSINIKNVWELEIALLLSKLGCITIPFEVLDNKLNGRKLTQAQLQVYMEHPQLGKKLLSNIPRFEYIGESIAYQFKRFDGSGYPADKVSGRDIPLFGRILIILNDIDELNLNGNSKEDNFAFIKTRTNYYDPEILKYVTKDMFIEDEVKLNNNKIKESHKSYYVLNQNQRNEVLTTGVSSLINGMVIAENVVNKNGLVIVYSNKEITEVIRQSLIHLAQLGTISDLIHVYRN